MRGFACVPFGALSYTLYSTYTQGKQNVYMYVPYYRHCVYFMVHVLVQWCVFEVCNVIKRVMWFHLGPSPDVG